MTTATPVAAQDIKAIIKEKLGDEKYERAAAILDTPRLLTLDYLARYELPVFVRNNSNVGSYQVIDIPIEGMQKPQTLEIENTDLPYELTVRWTYKQLKASTGLGKSIANRTVILVNPITALEYMENPSVQRRLAKSNLSRFSKDASDLPPDTFSVKPQVNENVIPGAPRQEVSADPHGNINNRLRVIVGEYLAKNTSDDDFEDEIANNARTFSLTDWKWLRTEVRNHAGVVHMCNQQIELASQQA